MRYVGSYLNVRYMPRMIFCEGIPNRRLTKCEIRSRIRKRVPYDRAASNIDSTHRAMGIEKRGVVSRWLADIYRGKYHDTWVAVKVYPMYPPQYLKEAKGGERSVCIDGLFVYGNSARF